MQTVTDALVLRERKLDEQDRLLTLLSADRGIITAYAKGAGRMKGSMAGATELLCYSHFVLFQNRERCFADKAEADTLFFGIRGDLEKLTLATYFAQLCCELRPENEPAVEEPGVRAERSGGAAAAAAGGLCRHAAHHLLRL